MLRSLGAAPLGAAGYPAMRQDEIGNVRSSDRSVTSTNGSDEHRRGCARSVPAEQKVRGSSPFGRARCDSDHRGSDGQKRW
jgi:hypothetical protein